MPRLFINYRRADSQGFAGRIYDRLAKAFGKRNVFMDMETLNPGEKFVESIEREATGRNAMLVLIGPNWAGELNKARLDDPGDYVRREIEMALNKGMYLIPVLVQGGSLPSKDDLPPSLHGVLYHNAFVIGPDFHSGIGQLIRRLKHIPDPERGRQIIVVLYTASILLKFLGVLAVNGPNLKGALPDLMHIAALSIVMVAVYVGLRWAKYLLTVYSVIGSVASLVLIYAICCDPEFSSLWKRSGDKWPAIFLFFAFGATQILNVYLLLRSRAVLAFLELQRGKYFPRLTD